MKSRLLRWIAILLVPCLLLEPVSAGVWPLVGPDTSRFTEKGSDPFSTWGQTPFQSQAIPQAASWVHRSLSRSSVRWPRQAAFVLLAAAALPGGVALAVRHPALALALVAGSLGFALPPAGKGKGSSGSAKKKKKSRFKTLEDAVTAYLRDYKSLPHVMGSIREFLQDFRTINPGAHGLLSDWDFTGFVLTVASDEALAQPALLDPTALADQIWKRVISSPDAVRARAKRVLQVQTARLWDAPVVPDFFPNTIRDRDLRHKEFRYKYPRTGVDRARQILTPDSNSRDYFRFRRLQANDPPEMIEAPARALVERIRQFGGTPVFANAYGLAPLGVYWLYQGEKYFTPLTLNDYPADLLDSEVLFRPSPAPEEEPPPVTPPLSAFRRSRYPGDYGMLALIHQVGYDADAVAAELQAGGMTVTPAKVKEWFYTYKPLLKIYAPALAALPEPYRGIVPRYWGYNEKTEQTTPEQLAREYQVPVQEIHTLAMYGMQAVWDATPIPGFLDHPVDPLKKLTVRGQKEKPYTARKKLSTPKILNALVPREDVQETPGTQGRLILVRHAPTAYNLEHRFTGWDNAPLSPEGIEQARALGQSLKEVPLDIIFTSDLERAKETADFIIAERDNPSPEMVRNTALRERSYGHLQGLSREEAYGLHEKQQVEAWRRGFTDRPPEGESLEDIFIRVRNYFEKNIRWRLEAGETVLIVGHGNTFRALRMHLEGISPKAIEKVEIPWARPIVYDMDDQQQLKLQPEGLSHSRPTPPDSILGALPFGFMDTGIHWPNWLVIGVSAVVGFMWFRTHMAERFSSTKQLHRLQQAA